MAGDAPHAVLDVRERGAYERGHIFRTTSLPRRLLTTRVPTLITAPTTPIAVVDADGTLAPLAATTLTAMGYTDVRVLARGLVAWRDAGRPVVQGVNVPSKVFGEHALHAMKTPQIAPHDLARRIERGDDLVIVDSRTVEEYTRGCIPGAISVPGAELVLRARALAPDPATRIVVNCAGRTRSIIGTQSLVNAGLPNPVAALRNGTMGWVLAGQVLDHGASRRAGAVDAAQREEAAARARAVAERAGVRRADSAELARFLAEAERTTYRFDVRTPEEFEAGHLPGFRSAPGGQLVQETDHAAPVRGARIVLVDDDGVRANMSGSWLAQMGWETWVLQASAAEFVERGPVAPRMPEPQGPVAWTGPAQLAQWLIEPGDTVVLDFSPSARYVAGHIPGAWFVLRSQLAQALAAVPAARRYVLTCGDSLLARHAAPEVASLRPEAQVRVLEGGNAAWAAAGLPLDGGETQLASPRIDRYRRPYEGTQAAQAAMQAYLEWEYGLVAQLARDGTHGFRVI